MKECQFRILQNQNFENLEVKIKKKHNLDSPNFEHNNYEKLSIQNLDCPIRAP